MAPPKGGGPANKQKQAQHQNDKKKPNGAVATARPVVVPAIPLPFMQRQASRQSQPPTKTNTSSVAPLVVSSSNGPADPVPSLEAALLDHTNAAHKKMPSASISDIIANGSNVEKPASAATTNGVHNLKTGNNIHTRQSSQSHSAQLQQQLNDNHNDTTQLRNTSNGTIDSPSHVSDKSVVSHAGNTNGVVNGLPQVMMGSEFPNGLVNGNSNGVSNLSSVHSTAAPSVAGDSTDFPPPFPHQNGHHQPNMRPQFGVMGFPESHTPSPAPLSGAFMPPPQQLPNHANGRHADMMPMSAMDNYHGIRTPVHQMPPFEGFPPAANGHSRSYGPPTPRSIHGSHASGETYHPHLPPPGPHNTHFAPYMGPHGHFPGRPSIMEGSLMNNIGYLQCQFNSPDLADCALVLELGRRGDNPGTSGTIHAHTLILAQSPFLKNHIMGMRARPVNSERYSLVVAADDPYLRFDAWYAAVQRLYLHQLIPSPPMGHNGERAMDFAGTRDDQFKFCLGYAAAGHLLQMDEIFMRGLHVAVQLLHWNTVEEALNFALEGATYRHVTYNTKHDVNDDRVEVSFAYGVYTDILMGAIAEFLVNAFPPGFQLDTTVSDPAKFARIPPVPTTPSNSRPDHTTPTIARGSSVRKPSKTGRQPSIKFGDLPTALPEDEPDEPSIPREPAKCSPLLSQILLNLQFVDLRYVLTSESNGVSGWNTAQDRYHAVTSVIAEREMRRLRAVEAVRQGKVPGWQDIQRRLSAPTRHTVIDQWDSLNWQEEVVQPSGAGVPRIIRHWVPQFNVAPEPEPEPTQVPSQSMV